MQDTASSNTSGIANFATGTFTGDGTICEVNLGFKPRYVKLVNLTDRIVNEVTDTMGFQVTAAVNISTKVFHYIAIG
jgi:hypothetical protein